MCLSVKVPIVSVVIGEGGSGGAIAIATGNRVYMLEHAIYSVISPEGAASILWRDSARAKEAATNMKITSEDLKALGIIDGVISEPLGGAHRDPDSVIATTGDVIAKALGELSNRTGEQLRNERRQKFLNMGRNL
jgi:acetyl-CoA carboxylase carboxyl transferase subunit alpha